MTNKSNKTVQPLMRRFIYVFFASHLEFRVRLFHVLAIGGTIISFVMCILSAANYTGITAVLTNAVSTALSFSLLMYSYRSGRYQFCYMVTIIGIFLGLLPFLFFSSGGYHSGMPAFFVLPWCSPFLCWKGKRPSFFCGGSIILCCPLHCVLYQARMGQQV